ncbi:MAG TPA: hypothetical protein VGN32_09140, partial [Ktedonobacterales bacterium]|nr:hypothetical protein [Ktedonobacterales bacterium]
RSPETMYLLGVQFVAQQNYTSAIAYFEQIQTQYHTSSYAKQAYSAAASAYYALGQSQLIAACVTAIPTFKTLAGTYATTPQGAKAKAALAAPVTVTGFIQHAPIAHAPVYLSRNVSGGASGYFTLSDDYAATLDNASHFTFHNVAPGQYDLSLLLPDGSSVFWQYSNPFDPYTVTVTPLCSTDAGAFNYTG